MPLLSDALERTVVVSSVVSGTEGHEKWFSIFHFDCSLQEMLVNYIDRFLWIALVIPIIDSAFLYRSDAEHCGLWRIKINPAAAVVVVVVGSRSNVRQSVSIRAA